MGSIPVSARQEDDGSSPGSLNIAGSSVRHPTMKSDKKINASWGTPFCILWYKKTEKKGVKIFNKIRQKKMLHLICGFKFSSMIGLPITTSNGCWV